MTKKKLFLLTEDGSDKKWSGKELLKDSVFNADGIDVSNEIAYGKERCDEDHYYCEFLRRGKPAPIQFIHTTRILAISSEVTDLHFDKEIEAVRLLERETDRRFNIFRPACALSIVDFEKSRIDRWPDDADLRPWHDPRGRMFLEPALRWDDIPSGVTAFRLADWPGISNIVVSDGYKKQIEARIETGYISFRELSL
ncbi:hypothetical protein [Pseudoxanthomonas sacheonensis]|uniref:Uncharacterized protein n=1 Tax=Pseudoxanthomonas sacheonensis TaxID=443615 RepID=A0ABU1RQU2_9GAMM|nr:hypothetical protein [Pseudoxanthomonas sacheonensis]MDR6841143.1 hypothetical protein [Pseudoxanthomonas sacheonensis]